MVSTVKVEVIFIPVLSTAAGYPRARPLVGVGAGGFYWLALPTASAQDRRSSGPWRFMSRAMIVSTMRSSR